MAMTKRVLTNDEKRFLDSREKHKDSILSCLTRGKGRPPKGEPSAEYCKKIKKELKEFLSNKVKVTPLNTASNVPNLEKKKRVKMGYIVNDTKEFEDNLEALKISNVKYLEFTGHHWDSIPSTIGNLTSLEKLVIKNIRSIKSLPESIGKLTSLKELICEKTSITSVPSIIGNVTSIVHLNLSGNLIVDIPEAISKLENLKVLQLNNNKIVYLPETITKLKNLEVLRLNNNKLVTLPDIGNLLKLTRLNLERNNKLTSLPESIFHLPDLEYLNIATASNYEQQKQIENNLPLKSFLKSRKTLKKLKTFIF